MVYNFTAQALNRLRVKIVKSIKEQILAQKGSPPSRLEASGSLRKSIKGVVFTKENNIRLNIYGNDYFDLVDKGGDPRRVDQNKILNWIRRKADFTLKGNIDERTAAMRISNSIAQKGTIARFGGRNKGANIIDYINKTYEKEITKEITDSYLKDMANFLQKEDNINLDGSK